MLNINQTTKFLLAIMLSFMLVACSSSSSNTTLSGVAATGAAIDGFVYVTDANGVQVDAATDPITGEYTVDVTGMTPPFILKVEPNGVGAILFSFATSSNQNINITPLTDLAMFIANGNADVATAYNAWSGTQIASTAIQSAQAVINANLSTQLTTANLDPSALNFFTTAFSTNGSGFDGVLDGIAVAVNTTSGTFTFTVAGAAGFVFNTGIDTSGVDILFPVPPTTNSGALGANETVATIPASIVGTYNLTYSESTAGSGISDGTVTEFVVAADGTLTIGGSLVLSNPVLYRGNAEEAIWFDVSNNLQYALSALILGFNEINVGSGVHFDQAGFSFYGQYRNAKPLPQSAGALAITGAGVTNFGVSVLNPVSGTRIVRAPTTTFSWSQSGDTTYSINVSSSDSGPSPISAVSITKRVTLTPTTATSDTWSLFGTNLVDLVGVSIDEGTSTVTFTNVTLARRGAGDIILNGTLTYTNL